MSSDGLVGSVLGIHGHVTTVQQFGSCAMCLDKKISVHQRNCFINSRVK